jgi:AraC family transcriptional regulator
MPVPETTSAEALNRYQSGTCLAASRGRAWRDIQASIYRLPPDGVAHIPAVNEPLLVWTTSGEVEIEEWEEDGPRFKSRIKRGDFFLTATGGSYHCQWRLLSPEPFEYMMALVAVPLLQRAMTEVFGAADAPRAQLRDVSAFTDRPLNLLMEQLRGELLARQASPLAVQSLAQLIAIYLARHYSEVIEQPHGAGPALPGFKLRQITEWMAGHFAEDFNLDQLAGRAGLSKFHFHRLFSKALGLSPSAHHTNLRMDAARALLRETGKSVTDVAFAVGYSSSSYFAQAFRKETGLSPSDYRRQR